MISVSDNEHSEISEDGRIIRINKIFQSFDNLPIQVDILLLLDCPEGQGGQGHCGQNDAAQVFVNLPGQEPKSPVS